MANRYSNGDVNSLVGREFFFDTNILMLLFYSQSSDWRVPRYSRLFSSLIRSNATITIDVTVISEFINAALRIEYKNYCSNNLGANLSYKDYRNSADGQQKIGSVNNIVRSNILSIFGISENKFNRTKIDTLLTIEEMDFNDKVIESVCKDNNYILVTDDADYKNSNVDILSLNNRF